MTSPPPPLPQKKRQNLNVTQIDEREYELLLGTEVELRKLVEELSDTEHRLDE